MLSPSEINTFFPLTSLEADCFKGLRILQIQGQFHTRASKHLEYVTRKGNWNKNINEFMRNLNLYPTRKRLDGNAKIRSMGLWNKRCRGRW